jgi:hypothetical protein
MNDSPDGGQQCDDEHPQDIPPAVVDKICNELGNDKDQSTFASEKRQTIQDPTPSGVARSLASSPAAMKP